MLPRNIELKILLIKIYIPWKQNKKTKKKNDENISYWIQIYVAWIKIYFDIKRKSDIIIIKYFVEHKYILIKWKYILVFWKKVI